MNSIICVVKNRRFDYKLLSEFIVKKQISLSEDYSKIKLTRDTLITGSCASCCLETSKNFRRMIEQDNLLCKICTIKNANKTRKNTCMQNYGVEYPMQNAEIAEKAMLSGFKYKNYILPSGKIINYQGYENFAIEHFIKAGVSEENIIIDRTSVPEVWYEYEGKKEILC
jgi:hypothetical protein